MPSRPVLDRCPGVLRPFVADDGAIVRVRQPGGRYRTETLLRLTEAAAAHGAPFLQLTSRGNLQLRGLPDPLPETFVAALADLGLLPSPTHERVRNIVAAPTVELDSFVDTLDDELQARASLAALSGRWLFVVTDSSGRFLDLSYDVAYQRLSPTRGRLIVGARERPCAPADAVAAMLDLADKCLSVRTDASVWNVRDLPEGSPMFEGLNTANTATPAPTVEHTTAHHGSGLTSPSTAAGVEVGVPLGLLSLDHARALWAVAPTVVVTPDRTVVVRNVADSGLDQLRGVCLDTSPRPATGLTACIGAPYCRRTDSPTIELAQQAQELVPEPGRRVHVVGCPRACGAPTADHLRVTDPRSVDDILTAIGSHE